MPSGCTSPTAARPYFGSSSRIVCPPARTAPASRTFSAAASKTARTEATGMSSGNAATERARSGRAPMAKMSLSAFVAATAPKSAGSSTSGGKKSTVTTRARSSSSRYTAASSAGSRPTRRSSGAAGRKPASSSLRRAAGYFAAQPPPASSAVSPDTVSTGRMYPSGNERGSVAGAPARRRDDLGRDRNRHLLRRPGADVEPDRRVDSRDGLGGNALGAEELRALGRHSACAHGAHVAGRRRERGLERRDVEAVVVREDADRRPRVD